MTCRAILADSLAKPPVQKVGKSGKPFAIVSVRETGNVEAEIYTPEGGEARVSWRFTADAVLTARKAPKSEGRS
jgi:hypothetical protein